MLQQLERSDSLAVSTNDAFKPVCKYWDRITRPVAVEEELDDIAGVIANAKKPLVIVGGGVRYSEAGEAVKNFCEEFGVPFGETQAGKSACKSSHPMCLGGIGVTGTYASNVIARDADVVIAIGSRLSDFTTSSKRLYKNPGVKFVTVNNCRSHIITAGGSLPQCQVMN